MSTTILTDVEIGAIIGRVYQKTHSKEIGELRFKGDVVAIGRAIEQAVLQSAEVQAWKRDAERWRMLPAFAEEYQLPTLSLFDQIDAAMEKQP